ncbi:MAG: alanyl-tRNA editing protein [Deltaproteobacteria bacterium]|jgi:Ser-tRNA(Ala) deacylase AlaX|nr:alanyl-tRNA editing protein [Deltaproteobacteria bacterium]
MSVEKVFWSDPYLRSLQACVRTVDGQIVTLNRTIIFAFSGGQQSDSGSIGGQEVLEAVRDNQEIRYTLPPGHGLRPGDQVGLAIDWDKRYRLMRLHLAAELVLELLYQRQEQNGLPRATLQRIGANIHPDKARLDFRLDEPITPLLPQLAQQANELIAADREIISAFSDREAERRYWEIAGFARVPCGGTHLRRTGEIGPLKLKRNNIGKGKERIEIFIKK